MTIFHLLLFIHILASMVWVGGGLFIILLSKSIERSKNVQTLSSYCAALIRLGGPVFGGSSMVVVITGIWMMVNQSMDFGGLWVSLSFIGWLISAVMGATLVQRSWVRVQEDLSKESASIDASQPLITRAYLMSWIDLVVRVVVVLLMVWKPT